MINPTFLALSVANPWLLPLAFMNTNGGLSVGSYNSGVSWYDVALATFVVGIFTVIASGVGFAVSGAQGLWSGVVLWLGIAAVTASGLLTHATMNLSLEKPQPFAAFGFVIYIMMVFATVGVALLSITAVALAIDGSLFKVLTGAVSALE